MRWLYDLAVTLALPIALPALARRGGLGERLGGVPRLETHPLWVHAVSVGEVMAALPLLQELHRRRVPLALSTVTATGREVATRAPVQARFFLPVDHRWSVDRALRRLRPRGLVLMETELWPNLICRAADRGLPVMLVNARVSDRSLRGYRRVRALLRPVLRRLRVACAQTELDAERLHELGAERVLVTGNLKFDLPPASPPGWARALRGRRVWVAGSTHQGEEEAVLAAFASLRREFPDLVLVLAPRHPQRLPQLEGLLRGWRWLRRSQLDEAEAAAGAEVLVLDTVGELAGAYAVADLAFVGGSLVPVGGHNPLEPAVQGVPVIYGPWVHNFREAAGLLEAAGGGVRLKAAGELAEWASRLLADERLRRRMGQAARQVVERHRGAVDRTLRAVLAELDGTPQTA